MNPYKITVILERMVILQQLQITAQKKYWIIKSYLLIIRLAL